MAFLKKISTAIRKKIAEHFSIMIIPHDEKKLFSFQISNSILIFIAALTILLAGTLYLYNSLKNELSSNIKKIAAEDKAYRNRILRYNKVIDQHQKAHTIYANKIDSFFQLIEGSAKNNKDLMAKEHTILNAISRKYGISKAHIPDNIPELKALTAKLESSGETLGQIENILEARKEILAAIPTLWPIKGHIGYKTSPFGMRYSPFLGQKTFHTGVDIAAPPRTVVLAAAAGRVSFTGIKSGYGNTVVINHNYGYKTLYGHNMYILAAVGDRVKKGAPIALVGKTGRATGYHVHFELRINNQPVDPWPYITTKF